MPGCQKDQDQCARVWAQLGAATQGDCLSIADVVRHSQHLEACFPELLERYSEVAVRGLVTWEAFSALYLGMPLPGEAEAAGRASPAAEGAAFGRGGWEGRSEDELRRLFDAIDSNGTGHISLDSVIATRDVVSSKIPELLVQWSELDSDSDGRISWEQFRYFYGTADEWLEYQLGEIVGLEDLKAQIRSFYRGVMLDRARRQRGHQIGTDEARYHMIFQGNPGTGKTSMARLMAKLLYRVGIVPKDSLVEVQQEQLVAGYLGQTALKTQRVIDGAAGGLLFIDEAYRLSQGHPGSNQFGKEAIEQLMAAMGSSRAPVMVFAGYTAEMQNFMMQNEGLYRRIPFTFSFPNYSCPEIAEILEKMVAKSGFELEGKLLANGRQRLARVIETQTLPQTRSLMNGGLCERMFVFAKQALDSRDDPGNPTTVLSTEDVVLACRQIPPPPAPSAASPLRRRPGEGGSEAEDLRAQVRKMQEDMAMLRKRNAQLERGASTSAPGRPAAEQVEVQHLTKEVCRMKAELHGKDEQICQLQRENGKLKESLQRAEAQFNAFAAAAAAAAASSSSGGYNAGRGSGADGGAKKQPEPAGKGFAPDLKVQYFSGSVNRWIDAVVVKYDETSGTYDLDVKRKVPPDRIRLPPPLGPNIPQEPAADSEGMKQLEDFFRRHDVITDGAIGTADLSNLLARLNPQAWSEDKIRRVKEALDAQGSGKVDLKEFLDWAFRAKQSAAKDQQGGGGSLDRSAPRETPLAQRLSSPNLKHQTGESTEPTVASPPRRPASSNVPKSAEEATSSTAATPPRRQASSKLPKQSGEVMTATAVPLPSTADSMAKTQELPKARSQRCLEAAAPASGARAGSAARRHVSLTPAASSGQRTVAVAFFSRRRPRTAHAANRS